MKIPESKQTFNPQISVPTVEEQYVFRMQT